MGWLNNIEPLSYFKKSVENSLWITIDLKHQCQKIAFTFILIAVEKIATAFIT